MAIKTITLLDGTTAYAHDVEDLVNPLYTDIDDTNIRLGADIQIKKLESSTNVADIIVGNASKVPTWVAMSGDATIDNTGKLTITSGTASALTPVNDTAAGSWYPVWVKAATGSQTPYVCTTDFVFNPANAGYGGSSTLAVDMFIGGLTGNVTGNCSGTSGGLANGTYSYGSGAVIVDARNCSGNAATVTNGLYTTDIGTAVPSPTGTGASGTWGISITGTADPNAHNHSSAGTGGHSLTSTNLYSPWIRGGAINCWSTYPLLWHGASGTVSEEIVEVDSTNSALVTLWNHPMPTNGAISCIAHVFMVRTDTHEHNDSCSIIACCTADSTAGIVDVHETGYVGAYADVTFEYVDSSPNIILRVAGHTTGTEKFLAMVRYMEVSY